MSTLSREQKVLSHIRSQVSDRKASEELKRLGGRDWNSRVTESIEFFVPVLVSMAPKLVQRLEVVFQGPSRLLQLFASKEFKAVVNSVENDPASYQSLQKIEQDGRTLAEGTLELVTKYLVAQQITKVIEAFLQETFGESVKTNGASLYPDIYRVESEAFYSMLPIQRSKKKGQDLVDTIHGPCVNGNGQPSKVPDGLELKSKRGAGIRVDCHAAHPGMFMVITWSTVKQILVVNDIALAYVRSFDYSECKRNTKATTVKYSFGGERFISLLK